MTRNRHIRDRHVRGDPRQRILVVEDDPGISEVVAVALRHQGYDVVGVGDGVAALDLLLSEAFDLVILDVMLPGLDGFEICRRCRINDVDVPIIFLTARDTSDDAVRGFLHGGDDYIRKPFVVVELQLRVAARLKRTERPSDDTLSYAALEMSVARHRVCVRGCPVELSPTEFRLLHYLLVNAERVVSKAQILEQVWRDEFGGRDNAVESCISNLRRKLHHSREPLIHTVRHVGYTLRLAA